jgi:hypothetical protein
VDLPDPPFSLPTTITWADRARVVLSADMRASENPFEVLFCLIPLAPIL